MKANIVKAVAGISVAGVVLTGITWSGSDIITDTKSFITNAVTKLESYKANESELVKGITDKNNQIIDLKEEIANLKLSEEANLNKIGELEAQVTKLEGDISELTTQLAEAETQNTSLTTEIQRLEVEINKANTEAAALQAELDKVDLETFIPTTSEEINALINNGN